MQNKLANWGIFLLLSLIWGSSFILMKIGMHGLSAYEVAGLRMLTGGLCLLPFCISYIRKTPVQKLPFFILTGLLGNGIPAFLFCLAETKIDSALAGILNALTPLFALLFGILIFHNKVSLRKVTGICIGFAGVCLLFASRGISHQSYWQYGLLVVLATICYGLNINIVRHYLQDFGSLQLAAISLFFMALLSTPFLLFSRLIQMENGKVPWLSLSASATLGVLGTGIASVLFYVLIRKAGALFASMVTYGIPMVAIGWGLLAGERISPIQVICLGVILGGVYLVNTKLPEKS